MEEATKVQEKESAIQENLTNAESVRSGETAVQPDETSVQLGKTMVQDVKTEVQNNEISVQNDMNSADLSHEASLKAARESTGRITDDGGTSIFFTCEQVKAMTPMQIKANYERIIESMSKPSF